MRAKGQWWAENHEVHGATVEGPLVAGSYFTRHVQNGQSTFQTVEQDASRWKRSPSTKSPTARSFAKNSSTRFERLSGRECGILYGYMRCTIPVSILLVGAAYAV